MPPKDKHQEMAGFLYYLIASFVHMLNLGAVRFAPLEMRLIPGKVSREPDILFIARDNLQRLTPERLDGPADLVVEIISEESVTRDRVRKFQEYQQAGVAEYWLIDPRPGKQQAAFYQRSPQGTYQAAELDSSGRYHSAVLRGFWLRPDWLWQEPLPDPLSTFLEVRGLPAAAIATLHAALTGEADDATEDKTQGETDR
jgi:Uma2 family endonuclease